MAIHPNQMLKAAARVLRGRTTTLPIAYTIANREMFLSLASARPGEAQTLAFHLPRRLRYTEKRHPKAAIARYLEAVIRGEEALAFPNAVR
jgi:hypothetical protein